MASLVQLRVEKEVKEEAEKLFNDLGLDLSTALRMFLKAAIREQKIPFKLAKEKDPFYSKANMAELERRTKELDEGKGITFTWEEFEAFSNACQNAQSQAELDALYQRAQKGWGNA